MLLFLNLNIFHTFSSVSIFDFEQVNVNWVGAIKLLYGLSLDNRHLRELNLRHNFVGTLKTLCFYS